MRNLFNKLKISSLRSLPIMALLLFFGFTGIAQNDLEFIKEKNADKTVSLSLKNSSTFEYKVDINLKLTGMTSDKALPISVHCPPGSTINVATLTPDLSIENRKYSIEYDAVKLTGSTVVKELVYDDNLTIYTKNNHTRSTELTIYLSKHNIKYHEIITDYNEETKKIFTDLLAQKKLNKKDVKLPIVIYKGEMHYDIKDIQKFSKSTFTEEGPHLKKSERKY